MKDYFREAFLSETEKHFHAACEFARFSVEAAIIEIEDIPGLEPQNPKFRDILAAFYAAAGAERLSGPMGFSGGPLGKLRSYSGGKIKAKEILSWVSKVRQLVGKKGHKLLKYNTYNEAYKGLDKALNGSLAMFDKSLDIDPNCPRGYSGRARAFQNVADGILMAYGIFPVRFLSHSVNEVEYEPVKYGDAHLGMCIKQQMPDLEFITEIIWLYEQAEEEYKEALRLDPTDTRSFIQLSYMLRQLGKTNEATDYVYKALVILNKAILVDNEDGQSYRERAQIFKELGKIELAISDLERLLTLSILESELDQTRWEIEELRKGEESGGGGQHVS